MRDKPVRLTLTQKVEEAETALEANLVRGASATDLRSHDRMLQTLDRLLERFPPSERPSWMLPLFVGAVAVSLLGLAALIRLPRPLVTVDTRISSIGVTAAADGDGLNSDAAFAVKSLEVAGDAKAQAIAKPAISISSFRLTPGTSAVMQQRASCVYVELPVAQVPAQPRMALGLDLVVLHAAGDGAELPVPSQLRAKPGTTVTIVATFPRTMPWLEASKRLTCTGVNLVMRFAALSTCARPPSSPASCACQMSTVRQICMTRTCSH